ncbi:hypothetical protein [Limisphaera sp. VF-2]|jgi:uncharacterized protein YukE|uniref:hypothetical protein n=1 Tax=Limisphaera sp. VF-2 TaxID=3400418 RepID=UPI00175DDF76|nr:hypothetical protein [Limisphaera sp.]
MTGAQNRLLGLLKDLQAHWDRTRECWRDDKALEFEQRFLNELTSQVNQTIAALDTLERVLQQIRRDCE